MFAALFLLVVVVLYRVFSGFAGSADFHWLHNFAPLFAIAVCGAVYLPKRLAVALPFAILLISDIVLNVFHYHVSFFTFDILPRYVALAIVTAIAFTLRGRANLTRLLLTSVAGSVIFYVISNTGSWLYPQTSPITQPSYAKTFAGWIQAMTIGLPGYPPTWTFYRYTLISDIFYTLLFFVSMSVTAKRDAAVPPQGAGELVRS